MFPQSNDGQGGAQFPERQDPNAQFSGANPPEFPQSSPSFSAPQSFSQDFPPQNQNPYAQNPSFPEPQNLANPIANYPAPDFQPAQNFAPAAPTFPTNSASPDDVLEQLNLANKPTGIALFNKIPVVGPALAQIPTMFVALFLGGVLLLVVIAVLASVLHHPPASIADSDDVNGELAETTNLLLYGQNARLSSYSNVNTVAEASLVVPSRQTELNKYFGSIAQSQSDVSQLPDDVSGKLANAVATSTVDDVYKSELASQLKDNFAALSKLGQDQISPDAKAAIDHAKTDIQELYTRLNGTAPEERS